MADARPGLLRSSALISAGVLASRVSGLLRVGVLTAVLGTTAFSDAYNLANTVPNIFYELVAGGVLSAVLLPLFVDLFERRDEDAMSAVVTVSLVGLAVVTLFGVLAAPALGWAFASIGGDPASRAASQEALTIFLRWFVPQVFFYGVMTVVTALLQSQRRFGAAAFAPLVNNLVTIAAFVLAPSVAAVDLGRAPLGAIVDDRWALTVLGLGTTLGVVANAALLLPAARGLDLRVRFRPRIRHPAVRRLLGAARGAVGFVLVTQTSVVATTLVALRYSDSGGYSAYTYANLFFFVVYGLLAVSITTALAPEIATAAQHGDRRALGREWARGLRLITLLTAPAAAGAVVLSHPLMGVLPLTAEGGQQTARILAAYGPGLLAYAVFHYVVRAFYALGDTTTPFRLIVWQQAIIVVVGTVAASQGGIVALAGAFSFGYVVTAGLAFRRFAVSVGPIPVGLVRIVPRIVAAAVAMALVVAAVEAAVSWGDRAVPAAVLAALGLVVGASSYAAYLRGFGADDDLRAVTAIVRRRLGR